MSNSGQGNFMFFPYPISGIVPHPLPLKAIPLLQLYPPNLIKLSPPPQFEANLKLFCHDFGAKKPLHFREDVL